MNEPIISRETLSEQAKESAIAADMGKPAVNPYEPGTAAAAAWQASFYRWVMDLAGEATA